MTYEQQKQAILASMSASYWLKEAIERLDGRDPLDALQDAEILKTLQHVRALDLLRKEK